jgi:hypothetical protein
MMLLIELASSFAASTNESCKIQEGNCKYKKLALLQANQFIKQSIFYVLLLCHTFVHHRERDLCRGLQLIHKKRT